MRHSTRLRSIVTLSFPQLNGEMLSANARIAIRHAWESKWYEWPLNLRGLLYYARDGVEGSEGGVGTTATVYLLGNPMVLWPMLAFIALTIVLVAFYLRCVRADAAAAARKHARDVAAHLMTRPRTSYLFHSAYAPAHLALPSPPLGSYKREHGIELATHFSHFFAVVGFCVAAYTLNLLPYLGVKRSAFIYHYMPALMYAEILAALTMDRVFGALGAAAAVRAARTPAAVPRCTSAATHSLFDRPRRPQVDADGVVAAAGRHAGRLRLLCALDLRAAADAGPARRAAVAAQVGLRARSPLVRLDMTRTSCRRALPR